MYEFHMDIDTNLWTIIVFFSRSFSISPFSSLSHSLFYGRIKIITIKTDYSYMKVYYIQEPVIFSSHSFSFSVKSNMWHILSNDKCHFSTMFTFINFHFVSRSCFIIFTMSQVNLSPLHKLTSSACYQVEMLQNASLS